MGEEVKKVGEEANNKVEDQKEEAPVAAPKAADNKEEEAAAPGGGGEEKKNEEAAASNKEPLPPPPPVILGIDLHCTGCANKIKRCILTCKGVEGVEVDMAKNEVTVKGIVDPQGICDRLRKRTKRNATVISSPPPPPPAAADAPADAAAAAVHKDKEEPVIVHSQVSEVTTVELLVNMHCEACAQQLHKKVVKMRGVQSAEADPGAGKLSVTGTMSSDKLVQYIHRRTGKLATVVAPLPPPPEAPNEDGVKKSEEPPAEGAAVKEDGEKEKPPIEDSADKKDAKGENKEEETATQPEDGGAVGDDEKAKPEVMTVDGFPLPPEEMMKRMTSTMYWPNPYKHYYNPQAADESMMVRMMPIVHPYAMPMMHWTNPPSPPPPPSMPVAPPMYHGYSYGMVERPMPAPQYFSDENPNACVIS